MRPKTLAIPSPMEMTVPNSLRSFYLKNGKISDTAITEKINTYHLVDACDLRLQDGNGISDRWFLVGDSSASEGS
jgi:hypothetical protein